MIDRRLILLLAGCAVFSGLIAVEFFSAGGEDLASNPDVAQPVNAASSPRQKPRTTELVAIALKEPLFSPTRRPPEGVAAAPDAGLAGLRLTGIVIKPDRRIAIFAPTDGEPLIRAEGESLNGWRLDSISPLGVSLSGPAGTRTLAPTPVPNPGRATASATVGRRGTAKAAGASAGRSAVQRASPATRPAGAEPVAGSSADSAVSSAPANPTRSR